MSEQATDPTASARHIWRAGAIVTALSMSALFVACESHLDDEADMELASASSGSEFRDGCVDGVEEYIDEDGNYIICIYTNDEGGGDGGGDPCWDFPWLCDPDDGGDNGDGGVDDNGGVDGGDDGGGEEPPPACTAAGNDCTTAQKCCGSNVCAFGGERENPWCQAFVPSAWVGMCVDSPAGTPVYRNGTVCRYTNGQEFNATCLSVQKQSCVIGYNGDCGNGTYTMRIRDLVQAPEGTCQG
jgi:hypothetical protein